MSQSSFRATMSRERARGLDLRTARMPLTLWSAAGLLSWLDGRPGRGRWR
jgi:hypothetical protein